MLIFRELLSQVESFQCEMLVATSGSMLKAFHVVLIDEVFAKKDIMGM